MEEAKHQWALEEVCFCSLSQFALFVRRPVQTGLCVNSNELRGPIGSISLCCLYKTGPDRSLCQVK